MESLTNLKKWKRTKLRMRKINLDHVRITEFSKTGNSKFFKKPDNKYFRLFRSEDLCCNYSTPF